MSSAIFPPNCLGWDELIDRYFAKYISDVAQTLTEVPKWNQTK